MKLFISIGLGAAIGILLFSIVTQCNTLFTFEKMVTTTTRNTSTTARNTTSSGGTWPLSLAQLPWISSDRTSEASTFTPPACTSEQLERTVQRHPGEIGGGCFGLCPTTFLTCCPRATWLEEYYTSQRQQNSKKQKSFLAINVGCNKGYDAVNLLRMGSNNPAVNRQTWKEAMPPDLKVAACNQDKESTMTLVSDPSLSPGDTETIATVYCVEPMPSTYGALLNASRITGWDNQLKVLQIAMNNEDPSTVLFPGPVLENLGAEDVGIQNSCSGTPDKCVPVETSRLDVMMTNENLADTRLNILLIDVEGYDFDVILGGNATLRNTEYIEFEYHNVGKWGKDFGEGKQPIKEAVEHLDDIGFTCYWAGKGELWRITGCWQPQFRGAYWSNVACANRQLAPSLLQIMERVFLETVSTTLHPKSPLDVMEFLVHNESRYDTVVLCDVDENERYELTVVDRNFPSDFLRPTCVWLDPPTSDPKPDRRGELQAAAERMGCIRIIAVDRKPPGVTNDAVETELYHFVRVLAQNGLYLGGWRWLSQSWNEVDFFYNETIIS